MVKIKNLSETVRKQIRLIPAEGATSDISGSTGAIAKDGEDILICLSPMVPPVVDNAQLSIIPVSLAEGIKAYYANGFSPADGSEKTYHDLATDPRYDFVSFGDGTQPPIYLEPSEAFVEINVNQPWPATAGYIARDLREMSTVPTWQVKFPTTLIDAVRYITATDPTRVILTETWVDLSNPDNNYEMPTTAEEFIDYVDNSFYGFWFGETANSVELTLTFNLGDGASDVVFRIKPTSVTTKRWNPNLISLNTAINIPGLWSGLNGYGFVEFSSEINGQDGIKEGGGSMYSDVKSDGTGGLVTLGARETVEAWVTPAGDGYIKAKLPGVNSVQFNLLTETDMDLSTRGTGVPGLTCHYMKTAVPEHKLFHHRFFYTFTTEAGGSGPV